MSNVVRDKSFAFAVRIVKLYDILRRERGEHIMSKQLLKSGTSIGANVREALNTQTQPDFVHKLSISQKECDETLYWLELLKETEYMTPTEYQSIRSDAEELLKIIRSIILTSISNKNK
ncbi:MAG: four helix bundle protein [Alistipes sp.]|jgi:four helix bundle protein|nr:four helix bundle protein [Alistipes sp.]